MNLNLLWSDYSVEVTTIRNEVLHVESEELIYWKCLDNIDSSLDDITSDYFHVLQTGLKL